jgi:hypothetical protein
VTRYAEVEFAALAPPNNALSWRYMSRRQDEHAIFLYNKKIGVFFKYALHRVLKPFMKNTAVKNQGMWARNTEFQKESQEC